MQEPTELGPLSAAVIAAVVSSPVLALISIVGFCVRRHRLDPHGGIFAAAARFIPRLRPTDGGEATHDASTSRQKRTIFLTNAGWFDFLWASQTFVLIASIALAGMRHGGYALALGIYQTLSQIAERRIWLGLAAACSILALGLLIGSVFLAQHGWLLVGMVVPLVIVSLGHVCSCVACAVVLYKAWKKMGVRSRWLFGGILAISVSSVGGCVAVAALGLAALQEDYDGYDRFLATLYFTGVPEVLAWFVYALGNRQSRTTPKSHGTPSIPHGSHPGREESGPSGADCNSSEDGLEFQCHWPSSSTANLVDVSSSVDSGQPRKSGVGQPTRRGSD